MLSGSVPFLTVLGQFTSELERTILDLSVNGLLEKQTLKDSIPRQLIKALRQHLLVSTKFGGFTAFTFLS